MLVVFDMKANRIVEAAGKRLVGECRRCGACCRGADPDCPHYREEDDGTVTCTDRQAMPVVCALYPFPNSPLLEGCGFRWVD